MLYETCESRNNIKYDNIKLAAKTIISKINKQIEITLKI